MHGKSIGKATWKNKYYGKTAWNACVRARVLACARACLRVRARVLARVLMRARMCWCVHARAARKAGAEVYGLVDMAQ